MRKKFEKESEMSEEIKNITRENEKGRTSRKKGKIK
jgi:hypothetical protein